MKFLYFLTVVTLSVGNLQSATAVVIPTKAHFPELSGRSDIILPRQDPFAVFTFVVDMALNIFNMATDNSQQIIDGVNQLNTKMDELAKSFKGMQDFMNGMNINVQLSEPNGALNAVQNLWGQLKTCGATLQQNKDHEEYKENIRKLVDAIADTNDGAFMQAQSIKNSVMDGQGGEGTGNGSLLGEIWKVQLGQFQDVLDLYNNVKGVSNTYLEGVKISSALLDIAARVLKINSSEVAGSSDSQALNKQKVDGWVQEWNNGLELGDSPIMPKEFTALAWTSKNAFNEASSTSTISNMGWRTHDQKFNIRAGCEPDTPWIVADQDMSDSLWTLKRQSDGTYIINTASNGCHRAGDLYSMAVDAGDAEAGKDGTIRYLPEGQPAATFNIIPSLASGGKSFTMIMLQGGEGVEGINFGRWSVRAGGVKALTLKGEGEVPDGELTQATDSDTEFQMSWIPANAPTTPRD